MGLPLTESDLKSHCIYLNEHSPEGGLFDGERTRLHPHSRLPWRISPEPFWISARQRTFLEELGPLLLAFYRASNLLYLHSVRGLQPAWVHRYLDQGKPERILELGRMNRFKSRLPLVIRPDLLLTGDGVRLVELDSVPGGMGFTGQVSSLYAELGYDIIGGGRGLVEGFYEALGGGGEPSVLIAVSDESDNYREEMQWLAAQLAAAGRPVYCRHPREIRFDEKGILVEEKGALVRIEVVYRFFELFDLPNIPRAELLLYFAKKNALRLTPPPKAFLEEKMWLALFHHPLLQEFWGRELGQSRASLLENIIPRSWILDPTPAPPHTVVPGLKPGGRALNDWNALKQLSKKERRLVLKPSGFSAHSSQSRGVAIGHDLPEKDWGRRVQQALEAFPSGPYVLQEFHKALQCRARYYDFERREVRPMRSRVLLRPYYYVVGDEARLAGIQAMLCPPDKKLLHGMGDAILVPCAVGEGPSFQPEGETP